MTNACLPCRLGKTYAVLWAGNRFVGSETPKHNAFDLENLNFIPNIFQETHGFSVLTDSVITCIYLRRSQRKVLWKKKTPTDIFVTREKYVSPPQSCYNTIWSKQWIPFGTLCGFLLPERHLLLHFKNMAIYI